MTESDFNLPPQCTNCRVLRGCVTEFYDQVDHFANTALEKGLREERAALAPGAPFYEQTLKAIETEVLLDVATAIAQRLHHKLQRDMDIVGLYCNGTDNPAAAEPQNCKSISSVVD